MRALPCFLPHVFTLELRKVLAYRVDFWIQFLGAFLVQFAVAYYLWNSIFEAGGLTGIGGYTFQTLMLYYVLAPLVGRAVRGNEAGDAAQDIYDGSLTRYLIYPVSYLAFRFTADLAHTALFLTQCLVALLLFSWLYPEAGISAISGQSWGMTLGAIVVGTALHFMMITFIELVAFWADNVWSLVVIERFITGLLGGSMLPLSLFPDAVRVVLEWLPFRFLISFPVQCCMGQVTPEAWGVGMLTALGWTGIFWIGFRLLWWRGLLRYTGVGM